MLIPKATIANVNAQLLLKATQATTYTKAEVETDIANKGNKLDLTIALALKVGKSYVDAQLLLQANQATAYTKAKVDAEIANNVNTVAITIALAL